MPVLIVLVSTIALSGCLSAPKNPLVYEDANVAIYKVCNPSPIGYVCHQELVRKKAGLEISSPEKTLEKPSDKNN